MLIYFYIQLKYFNFWLKLLLNYIHLTLLLLLPPPPLSTHPRPPPSSCSTMEQVPLMKGRAERPKSSSASSRELDSTEQGRTTLT